MKYLEMRMNQPDKADWYVMQQTAYMLAMMGGKVPDVNKFRMNFEWTPAENEEKPKKGMSKAEYSKRAWLGMVGGVARNADQSNTISDTVTVVGGVKK